MWRAHATLIGSGAAARPGARAEARAAGTPRLGGRARLLVAVAALLPLLAFAFPLWRYDLDAPQYPEGIRMTIWINGLGGRLDLVNGLNHYIGMRTIEPGSFPELTLMPWLVGALCATGLAVALVARRAALMAWLAGFAAFAVVGLADFAWWLYRFGHELSPEAPIAVDPFMPPILGPKSIANFTVTTYPDVGGLALIAALLLGVVVLLLERRGRPPAAP
jgi:copper chaperone NosL